MKHIKLFEEFELDKSVLGKYELLKPIPREGDYNSKNPIEIHVIINALKDMGYEEPHGRSGHDKLIPGHISWYAYKDNGHEEVPASMQHNKYYLDKYNQTYVDDSSEDDKTIIFNEYFKIKPQFKGWEAGNEYGI